MATLLKPFNKIKLLFQGLSGSFDIETDDDEGYDKNELEEINKMSAININNIEKQHGNPTIKDDEKEEKDRLGIKKPTILKRTSQENTVNNDEHKKEEAQSDYEIEQ